MQKPFLKNMTRNFIKALKFLFIVFVLLAIAKLTLFQRPEDEVWRIKMASGTIFDVPFRYLAFPYPTTISNGTEKFLKIMADVYSFQPMKNQTGLDPDSVQIILNDKSYTNRTFPELIELYKTAITPFGVYGPEDMGLIKMLQTPGKKNYDDDDLWIEKDKGKEISALMCTPIHLPFNHFCTLHFMYRDQFVEIKFRRSYISQWKYIKNESVLLLESFINQQPNTL